MKALFERKLEEIDENVEVKIEQRGLLNRVNFRRIFV